MLLHMELSLWCGPVPRATAKLWLVVGFYGIEDALGLAFAKV